MTPDHPPQPVSDAAAVPHRRRPRYSGKNPRRFQEKYKEHDPGRYADTIAKVLASGKTPAGMHRPILVAEIFSIIKNLHSEGLTIFLVEQNVKLTMKVADYCYVMENGRVVQQGTGQALEADPKVREAYLGL